jgi:hypothetical protein
MRHAARQLPSWLIFDVRQYPLLYGRRRFEMRSEIKPREVVACRVKSSTPESVAGVSDARIGVRGLDYSVLVLSAPCERSATVPIASGGLLS